jgi:predicted RND superfamily exporter protein
LLQAVVFRSLRIGLISIVPNLLPVLACFVALRVFKIQLKIDTALVLCISVGGLFNTTIHFAARTRQLVAAGEVDPDVAVGRAMRAVGPPALFTALALSAGFSVLLLSGFPGLRALGLLSMVTLTVGFFSDMIVTAVLLRVGFDWNGSAATPAPRLVASIIPGHVAPEEGKGI